MADLPALELLRAEKKKLSKIKSLIENNSDVDVYRQKSKQAYGETASTLKQVMVYTDQIQSEIRKVSDEAKFATRSIEAKIREQFQSLRVIPYGRGDVPVTNPNIPKLEEALKLQKLAKEIADQRLDELVTQTKLALENCKGQILLSQVNIDTLMGCLDGWTNAEKLSFQEKQRKEEEERERQRLEEERRQKEKEEEEKRRKKEEIKRKEEEDRKRKEKERREREETERKRREKEEEEIRRKEEEERKRKAEEERKLKEKEEEEKRKREEKERREREEAERKRREKEDEERRRKEEEERKQKEREEEEKRQQEEKERRKKDEEERKRKKIEEDRIRREEEEKRRKAEAERKRQQLEREEAERRRLNPDNWDPLVYRRPECNDEVDGETSYHKGICCILTAPDGSLDHDDVICNASDEVDDIIQIHSPGDKTASSLISIVSTKGPIKPEVPLRVHVPHAPVPDGSDEVVIKYSVDGTKTWVTQYPIHSRKSVTSENLKLSCIELDAIESVQMIVVSRKKGETIMVDIPGIQHKLAHDKNTKLVMTRGTYQEPTEIRVTMQPVYLKEHVSMAKQNNQLLKDIVSVSSMMTVNCQRPPQKSFELDISQSQTGDKQKGKQHHVYRNKEGQWSLATTEIKGIQDDVSVTLPSGKTVYSYLQLCMPANTSMEDVFKAAEALFLLVTKTIVHVLVRQKTTDPTIGVLHVVSKDNLQQRLKDLADKGYDFGDACSTPFALEDGDKLQASLVGNVAFGTDVVEPITLTFFALFDKARMHLRFAVKDPYLQREFPNYMGRLICVIVPGQSEIGDGLKMELPICIPKCKRQRPKSGISWVQVRFPHYLTVLTTYLAGRLSDSQGSDWISTLRILITDKTLGKLHRRARNKYEDGGEATICRTVLLDWMKEQPRQDDKVKPILDILIECKMYELAKDTKDIVDYFKVHLSDDVLRDICTHLTGSPADVGKTLGFTSREVNDITRPVTGDPKRQMFLLLAEWRETDRAVGCGLHAADELRTFLS